MSMPRLEFDLDKIHHNALVLVERLAEKGVAITGVTKSTLGEPAIAGALIRAGVCSLGDARIENIESMQEAGLRVPMALIRSPMLSQVDRVVRHADLSFNTELEIIRELSLAAQKVGRTHGIVLMVELGDLREGIMPGDLEKTVHEMLHLSNLNLRGIGTNLACRYGVAPDAGKMAELSALVESVEARFDLVLEIVSGGNSANLNWAFGHEDTGRINHLRLGESILLGRGPLHRQPIEGLHLDAFRLVVEVIESKVKPSAPTGDLAQSAFADTPPVKDRGLIAQSILAVGRQDIDPSGLLPPPGMHILGASSDHLVVSANELLPLGGEVSFHLNYSALVRAMTSPFLAKLKRAAAESVAVPS